MVHVRVIFLVMVVGSLVECSLGIECPYGYVVVEACQKASLSDKPNQVFPKPLDLVNELRKQHHAPAMTAVSELEAASLRAALKCATTVRDDLQFGETSYKEYVGKPSTQDEVLTRAITAWYGTITLYDFKKPEFSAKSGHSSQLLWKSSTMIGCAMQLCQETPGNTGVYNFVVCSYFPPGNIAGKFAENVQSI
jgi:hypothetical protein